VGAGTYRFAVDAVRGDLGESRVAAASLASTIGELAADDRRPVGDGRRHRCWWPVATVLAGVLVRATEAADRGYGTLPAAATATTVHVALAAAADLDRWVGTELAHQRLTEEVAPTCGPG